MSATRNDEALANAQPGGGSGEFSSRKERDEPMMTGGHQPGKLVGNDAVPEFSAQTLPPGSAPSESTFKPNNISEVPPVANMSDRADPESEQTSASDTLGGATSGDVHTGLGHPGQGQTSQELHHDGQHGRKNQGQGLQGVGATATEFKTADPHDPDMKHLRALDKDEAEVGRGTVGGPPAQDRVPESAETVATETKLPRN